MEKGQIVEIRIEDMTEDGAGIGKYEGYPLFVKDTVPGDFVRAQVIKDKGNYGFGRVMEIIEPSPDRVEPICPISRPCGGCQLQAMSYGAQLAFKQKRVTSALTRIGGQPADRVLPIIGMDEPVRYRNKAEYPVRMSRDGRIVMGFYAGHTHSVIECEDCIIGQQSDMKILSLIRGWMERYGIAPYDEESGRGLVRHVMIRTSHARGEQMVTLVINGKRLPHQTELAAELGFVSSLSYSINTEKNNVIMGREVRFISGRPYIEDEIGGIVYRISPQSFYQVNPLQTEKLYRKALEYAQLSGGETVWDLYCGIGTISLFLAQKARKVYGVEIIPAAIDNARENAAANGIANAEFFVGKAEEVLPGHFAHTGERADVIVVDPPRKGCDETLLRTIVEMAPERVVYVSCDPATLARDVKILADGGYELRAAQPVDMFAQTVHVEVVTLITRDKIETTR
ncbi:MAG: 23S rRNA (uracil(1939)-C(5))-methyltransferase RlmD [Lachnospiraceae bacterium]|nr:23S rRNA (uracil(1939)-C(5))-methyltransferase RlmD [Lachnospiraceae bacterium]